METESGGSPARVVGSGVVGTETGSVRFLVAHEMWEGWLFALSFKGSGEWVGFEMYGDGPSASDEGWRKIRGGRSGLLPPSDAIPLTARLLRSVPFRELEAAVRRRLSGADGVGRSLWLAQRLGGAQRAPGKARTTWTEHELAKLCAEYVALLDYPNPRPLWTLAERRLLTPKYVRHLLAGVRGDLITEAPAGQAGGRLTDKAKEILSGQHQAP